MTNFLKDMFTGRMSKKEFLLPGLFFVVLTLTLSILLFFFRLNEQSSILAFILSLILFFLFLPYIIKRLHDIGLPGWLSSILFFTTPATLFFYVPIIKVIPIVTDPSPQKLILLILSLVHVFSVLFLLFKPDNKTENKYGAPIYKKYETRILLWIIFFILIIITIIFHCFILILWLFEYGFR